METKAALRRFSQTSGILAVLAGSIVQAGGYFDAPAGLGLSICRKIVEAHGGAIDFSSELGAGTIFRVALPAQKITPSPAIFTPPPQARSRP